jgi:hypothetical protein
MRTVEKWRWRTYWPPGSRRLVVGKVHYTEEEIKARHPEAQKVPHTMKLVEVPETKEELEAVVRSTLTSSNQRTEYHPDGSVKKMWEK